jgi:hypothetical protein
MTITRIERIKAKKETLGVSLIEARNLVELEIEAEKANGTYIPEVVAAQFAPDPVICPNTPYGVHIRVRCAGCGSLHSTKNIGGRNSENVVYTRRSVFDRTQCTCKDPREFPLVHVCELDDLKPGESSL